MAASVLLGSADSAGLSFTIGGGGTGNSNGLGPAPWNRSLDRALDEAAATGSLNLSGRKLKEFPRCAANHDLTDTTRAGPRPSLNAPPLSRNQLSVLPAVVCGLPLKVLIACNNKLVSLPEELGQLRHLTELDVSCNEIQTLPAQVGQLEALRDLNIRRNHLVRLPPGTQTRETMVTLHSQPGLSSKITRRQSYGDTPTQQIKTTHGGQSRRQCEAILHATFRDLMKLPGRSVDPQS
ncbi:DISP complex protein LRCH3-like [Neolamprologus brichardi]|uniref:DISP complex protein LRCH3-like n=1 Tax=Neolamprologus brichardi TaxID=32507 RepID=UPI001643DD06|nr:DISP complex protein LRCH3-like [Neolamprologus brichardi]